MRQAATRVTAAFRFATIAAGIALAAGVTIAGGCSFQTRSGDLACGNGEACPADRSCQMGWCVVGTTGDASGIDAVQDSGPTTDAVPADSAVPDCNNGVCGAGETPINCPADCADCGSCSGGHCADACGSSCTLTCPVDSCACEFDCAGANGCIIRCPGGSRCDIDCTGANNCGDVRCVDGAECILDCTGANNCDFARCRGGSGTTSCANNIIVCNRACP